MTAVEHTATREQLLDELKNALRRGVDGEVRFDLGARATYSTDASNYRQIPIGVVVPRTPEAAANAVRICHDHDVPVFSRGGGTSLAGESCNVAVVLDWSRYCTRVLSVDAEAGIATVEPGIKLDELNDALAETGWMVGPKPATHVSCTIGGMIGNNSCGSTAQAYGKMADSVRRMEVLTYDGVQMWVGPTDDADYERIVAEGGRRGEIYRALRRLRDHYGDEVRARYPDIPRRVSGYNLDSLLPENGFDVAKLLVGSESTLVTVLRAEIDLVRVPPAHVAALLAFPDIAAAADAVPAVLEFGPAALEGMDHRLTELEQSQHMAQGALSELPEGRAWLLAQFNGDDVGSAASAADSMVQHLCGAGVATGGKVMRDAADQKRVWAAREGGLGATAHPPGGPDTHPGWEDAAVPPDRVGDYLRDFGELLERFGYQGASQYGHFGHGCIHTRIPFDLKSELGIRRYREFATAAAQLVTRYGGSLSGEHGDGQARGELLSIMFGERLVGAFEELKRVFDPANRMNPGKVVFAAALDEDLRWGPGYRPQEPRTHFAYPDDDHRFSVAADRCVGVGKCRGHESGVMCPSYRATGEEEHSTRGRARLLFEMLEGDVITDGWQSTEVRDALDLCLACKGCRSDCPVNVDMATYKAEFLSHHYKRRLRPLAHYSMGWLPLLARIAMVAPRPVNAVAQTPGVTTLLKRAGGIDTQRDIPRFARQRFTRWFARRPRRGDPAPRGPVLLWPDTFTNNFDTAAARAAVAVLEDAGFEVRTPGRAVCCGLTWISTGQLDAAKYVARRTLEVLKPALRESIPVVVLEPSCAAVFRADLPELLDGDEDVHRLASLTRTLGEVLRELAPDWRAENVEEAASALVQPHCHQHAILGTGAEVEALRAAGTTGELLDAGCCGLAGNFGFEAGHYDVSIACAEDKLMPAVRSAPADKTIVADGFSCRTQIRHLDSVRTPMHTAQVLAAALDGASAPQPPGDDDARGPSRDGLTAAAFFGAGVLAIGWAVWRRGR
ncbi:MAG: FAD-binding and (Fe-S)-binding domain-containing protein [Actinomycetota bacterium]|nr:FAD-binding and (Fe-S)-binding domain-containing protein [Actinomycetota bacterium]